MADWRRACRSLVTGLAAIGRRCGRGAAAASGAEPRRLHHLDGLAGLRDADQVRHHSSPTTTSISSRPSSARTREIITKLQAGGIGKHRPAITMYFGYLPLMAEGGPAASRWMRPRITHWRSRPAPLAQDAIKHDGNLDGRALELGFAADHVRSLGGHRRRPPPGSTS